MCKSSFLLSLLGTPHSRFRKERISTSLAGHVSHRWSTHVTGGAHEAASPYLCGCDLHTMWGPMSSSPLVPGLDPKARMH